MATQNGFSTSTNRYTSLQNACCNDFGHQVSVMDDEIFELPSFPSSTSTETYCYSSSSEEYSMQGFCQLDNRLSLNSSSLIMSSPSHQTSSTHSAFKGYIKADPKAALDSLTPGHVLHKRCFRYLSQIEENRKSAMLMSSLRAARAPAANDYQHKKSKIGSQRRSPYQHLMAERNRRAKLNQLFSNLYSLVPARNSKTDRYSILANTITYLRDLKFRVAQLEQQIQSLEGSSGFDSLQQPFNSKSTGFYNGHGVALEQCKDIPCQVKLRISVERDVVSCPAALLTKVLEQLRVEQLQLVSIHSHTEASSFHTSIVIQPKGQQWDICRWQYFGDVMRRCVTNSCD